MNPHPHPPEDWMRICAVDPGTYRAGALCAAIPPEANCIHFYAEIMLHAADAHRLGSELAQMMGEHKFESFIMDARAGRQTPMGFTMTVAEHYQSVFEELGLNSRLSQSGFEWGSDNLESRELALKKWMRHRGALPPMLSVHRHLVQFDKQITEFFYKKLDPSKRDERGKALELVHCAEYLAAYFENELYYERPEPAEVKSKESNATRELKKIIKGINLRAKHTGLPVGSIG